MESTIPPRSRFLGAARLNAESRNEIAATFMVVSIWKALLCSRTIDAIRRFRSLRGFERYRDVSKNHVVVSTPPVRSYHQCGIHAPRSFYVEDLTALPHRFHEPPRIYVHYGRRDCICACAFSFCSDAAIVQQWVGRFKLGCRVVQACFRT